MLVVQAHQIKKTYGDRRVLNSVNLSVQKGERVGLVGVNGCGKSTLLGCISGEVLPDEGEISIAAHCRLACLEQTPVYPPQATPWEVVMGAFRHLLQMREDLASLEQRMGQEEADLESVMRQYGELSERFERADGFACETTARRILSGLGFAEPDFHRPFAHFSGGQKTRLSMARLLAEEPDILLLDEPTNHLDLASIEWLEEFLGAYSGTILVVSHDRAFLDRIATRIVDLHQGKLYSYPGNYSRFAEQKLERMEAWNKAYQKQQEQIQAAEAYIRRYRAGVKARQARGRQARLDRLERMEKPRQNDTVGLRNLEVKVESGQEVLLLHNVSKRYPHRLLFGGVQQLIRKGERVSLVGPNGCGKSTLLKIIVGEIQPDSGSVSLGSRVRVGYFSQEHEGLHPQDSLLEHVIRAADCTLEEARTWLGRMLFSGDDVFKKVADLSGGEKARLSLLNLLLTGANLLVLDEPTNHMDMESRVVVEDLLSGFEGTILMVSHDRCLIDRLATRLLVFEGERITSYTGNYTDYKERPPTHNLTEAANHAADLSSEQFMHRNRRKENQRVLNRLQKDRQQAEERIEQLEQRIAELETLLADPARVYDLESIGRLGQEHTELGARLDQAYADWEELSEQWEKLTSPQVD